MTYADMYPKKRKLLRIGGPEEQRRKLKVWIKIIWINKVLDKEWIGFV